MLTIHYFASIREALKSNEEHFELPSHVSNVGDLIDHLLQLHPHFEVVFRRDKKVLVAVNQTVVASTHTLTAGDEVAFFPPMTGG